MKATLERLWYSGNQTVTWLFTLTFQGINRVNDALVDVGPSLLLATMRTDSDMITTRIATEDLSVDDNIVL